MALRVTHVRPRRAPVRAARPRPSACVLSLSLALCAPSALAQREETVHIESLPPQSPQSPENLQSPQPSTEELTILVHALPPSATPAAGTGESAPRAPASRWAPTDPPDTPAEIERAYAPGLVAGVSFGAGGPAGLVGVFADFAASRTFSARVGAGISPGFGPSLDLGASVRPLRVGRWSGLASLGLTAAWTPETYRALDGLNTPETSLWINPALGVELRLRPLLVVRLSAGLSALLNTGAFENRPDRGWYGPARPPASVGWSPVEAADAHDAGRALLVPTVWLDVGALGPRW
jgi:hypothetical protein